MINVNNMPLSPVTTRQLSQQLALNSLADSDSLEPQDRVDIDPGLFDSAAGHGGPGPTSTPTISSSALRNLLKWPAAPDLGHSDDQSCNHGTGDSTSQDGDHDRSVQHGNHDGDTQIGFHNQLHTSGNHDTELQEGNQDASRTRGSDNSEGQIGNNDRSQTHGSSDVVNQFGNGDTTKVRGSHDTVAEVGNHDHVTVDGSNQKVTVDGNGLTATYKNGRWTTNGTVSHHGGQTIIA